MYRKTSARVVGALFLTATAAGVLSLVLLEPLDTLSSPQFIADRAHRISAGALMVLVMIGAIALIPPTLFPVLKKHGEALALGYVAARIIEIVLLLPGAIGPLMLVAIGTGQSADNAAHLDTVRTLTRTYDLWGNASSMIFFCLGALLLNFLLYRSGLVPRWIAGWALVAVVPYLADACLVMFGALTVSSTVFTLLVLPLALNEMELAVWLLTKGVQATVVGDHRSPEIAHRLPSGIAHGGGELLRAGWGALMRWVFVGTPGFLGRVEGPTRCAFWSEDPQGHGFDPGRLVAVDLAHTPAAAAAGVIGPEQVQVDDCFTGPNGAVAGTTIGPAWPELRMSGAVYLEQRFVASLPVELRPACPPTGASGRVYECLTTVYWPRVDDPRAGTRYAGHHAQIIDERDTLAHVAIWPPGRSGDAAGPAARMWIDLASPEQCDAGPDSLTTIGVGDAPKHGALFLISGHLTYQRETD